MLTLIYKFTMRFDWVRAKRSLINRNFVAQTDPSLYTYVSSAFFISD
jgi:hypothetical protein